jgi:membrane protein required for colicin V production
VNWVDIAIPAIIVVSALFSLVRGFVREALALAGWIAAVWVALRYARPLAGEFLTWIDLPSARLVIAFTFLFVVTLVLAAMVIRLAAALVEKSGLTGTDRLIGLVFGLARGVLVVAALVLLAGMTTMPQANWWEQSQFIGVFEQLAIWLQQHVAPDIGGSLRYG